MKCSGLGTFGFVGPDDYGGAFGPFRNSQVERELPRLQCVHGDVDFFVERIVSPHVHLGILHLDVARGIAEGDQPVVFGSHPKMRNQFRPTLVHVREATAEGWFEAEQIRFRSVVAVDALPADLANDLVHLLIVLMGPHVVGEGRRQRIERDGFEAVGQPDVRIYGEQVLKGEHHFDDGAKLCALRRMAARDVFVGGEHASRLAVIFVEVLQERC